MEVEAVDEGTVAKIVVPEGTEGVKVNALIAVLAGEGEDAGAAAKAGGAPEKKARGSEGRRSARSRKPQRRRPRRLSRRSRKSLHQAAPAPAPNGHAAGRPHIRLAAGAPHRQGSRHRHRRGDGSGPHGRVVQADVEAAIAGGAKAAPQAKAGASSSCCACRQNRCRRCGAEAVRGRLLRARPARQHAQDHRPASGRGEVDHPAFLSDARLRDRRAAQAARRDQCRRSGAKDRQGRRPGLQGLGQRHGHQGDGAGAARRAGANVILDRGRDGASTSTPMSASRCRSPAG